MPNLRLRTTGVLAAQIRRCPPKGESTEPLCTLRDGPDPSFDFGPGPLLFLETWEEQPLAPVNIFDEMWEFSPFAPGTLQFNELWEEQTFVLGPNNFTETWDGPAFNPVIVTGWPEPWEASNFVPGTLQFLEEWEAAHVWFKSEYFTFGSGGGGGG